MSTMLIYFWILSSEMSKEFWCFYFAVIAVSVSKLRNINMNWVFGLYVISYVFLGTYIYCYENIIFCDGHLMPTFVHKWKCHWDSKQNAIETRKRRLRECSLLIRDAPPTNPLPVVTFLRPHGRGIIGSSCRRVQQWQEVLISGIKRTNRRKINF